MFGKKETLHIVIITIVLAFSITLVNTFQNFLWILLGVFIILLTNTLAKKITAFFLESEVEVKIWEFKRYSYKPSSHFQKPFPAGIVIPLISKLILLPLKNFIWMAAMTFDVKAKPYRGTKRHGAYSFSQMSEDHIGYIAAAGIITNLIFAIIFYFIGIPEFAKLNIYFAFFNMIPLSNLDGNKIFFGSLALWNVLAVITLIAMGYSFLLV